MYRHSTPSLHGYALEYAAGAELDGRIVILAYDSSRERTGPDAISEQSIPPVTRIRLASADPARHYRLRSDGSLHSGAALRSAGVIVPWAVAADADVLVFDRVE
ncbi:GH36 C-terminal domain-containing protein [Agromyces ramosus]|uniref:GH36 C-terminal domain-containing protein n=1 Tax=Agromyces ramosus TaxID=33879 RepID=UPI0027D8DEF3|nr:GH36 C-terminal domain-containing protein [Agromyces ramosus]